MVSTDGKQRRAPLRHGVNEAINYEMSYRPLNEVISDCCSVRDYNRSEDLIPISASCQRSISNDVEVCAPVNGDFTIHQHSLTAKSDTFVHERRIIPTATVPPDETTPIIPMNRKTGLVRKITLLHSFLLQFTCSVAHSLRSRRCLDVSLTHTICRRVYRPKPWSRFRTV
ncbi:hypothetical protein TNCV_4744521 [Trichonephila clavipes]|nr:hypothetical protein TNCV_4744521 [Trichonephila clavipes]